MLEFDPNSYGNPAAELLVEDRLCELGPGRPNQSVRPVLDRLQPGDVVLDHQDPQMAACCLSGLWLWHDFLHESHELSQDIGSSSGSYWHGIMHRREPDYSNAKYWYRRVGDHEIFPALKNVATEIATSYPLSGIAAALVESSLWDPYAFVDLCGEVARGRSDSEMFCREVARAEWQLLFDHCFHQAL